MYIYQITENRKPLNYIYTNKDDAKNMLKIIINNHVESSQLFGKHIIQASPNIPIINGAMLNIIYQDGTVEKRYFYIKKIKFAVSSKLNK